LTVLTKRESEKEITGERGEMTVDSIIDQSSFKITHDYCLFHNNRLDQQDSNQRNGYNSSSSLRIRVDKPMSSYNDTVLQQLPAMIRPTKYCIQLVNLQLE
jgi:hypothetical protein